MTAMVEVVIDSVRVSLMSPQRMVILRQVDMARYLPIWIGPYEAEAISVALQEVEMARPLTHDLLKNFLDLLKARVLRIEIRELKDDIFYGSILLEADGKITAVDSRPSDAIALAVRVHVPILVSREVMDAASIVPEADLQAEPPGSVDEAMQAPPPPDDQKRLDIFDEFLKKMDKDKGNEESQKN
jgi:uncharacterized protein